MEREVEIGLPQGEESIPVAIDGFRDFAREHGVLPKVVNDFCIILDEVLSNIIKYGFRGRDPGLIELRLRVAEENLEIEIVDDSPPFNMIEARDPRTNQPVASRTIGGLGIYMVKKLSDELRYDCIDGRNRLLIRKRLRA